MSNVDTKTLTHSIVLNWVLWCRGVMSNEPYRKRVFPQHWCSAWESHDVCSFWKIYRSVHYSSSVTFFPWVIKSAEKEEKKGRGKKQSSSLSSEDLCRIVRSRCEKWRVLGPHDNVSANLVTHVKDRTIIFSSRRIRSSLAAVGYDTYVSSAPGTTAGLTSSVSPEGGASVTRATCERTRPTHALFLYTQRKVRMTSAVLGTSCGTRNTARRIWGRTFRRPTSKEDLLSKAFRDFKVLDLWKEAWEEDSVLQHARKAILVKRLILPPSLQI
jgi:hypothetical protein